MARDGKTGREECDVPHEGEENGETWTEENTSRLQ
jgi:hypothetical protein